jgi:hypothetical protein
MLYSLFILYVYKTNPLSDKREAVRENLGPVFVFDLFYKHLAFFGNHLTNLTKSFSKDNFHPSGNPSIVGISRDI